MKRMTWAVVVLFVMNILCYSFPGSSEASVRQELSPQEMNGVIGGYGQAEVEILFPHGSSSINQYESVGEPLHYIIDVNNIAMYAANYTINVDGTVVKTGQVSPFTSALITGTVTGLSANYHYIQVELTLPYAWMLGASDSVYFAKF